MEFASVQNLCLHLICSAYQRCRLSEQICRLSIVLARSSSSLPSSLRVSISDTGIGSCLEEYQYLRFSSTDVADNWDGMLCIKTTSISESEILNYQINLKESGSSRMTELPSITKNGAKFSGSEVCLSAFVSLDPLLAEVHIFLQKMLILRIPNVAIQLVAEDCDVPGSRYEKVFLADECNQLPNSASNLELLKSGLIDYVLKHGNNLSNECNSCFPSCVTQEEIVYTPLYFKYDICWYHLIFHVLKVGSGEACCTENRLHTELVMEVVIVMSNISTENTACFREYGDKTKVLYFKDFSPCTMSRSSMKALKSTDWKRYGLNLGGIVQQDGFALLEWENLPTDTHIDIVLHSYHKQTVIPAPRKMSQFDRSLVKRAVKLSLDDLKEKHSGLFLSPRSLQIRSYAPDLAKTISGLILSSNDLDFQGECFSLLGLQSQEVGIENVENCIKERIVSVIEMNDRKPNNSKEVAPFLFEDDRVQEMELQENDEDENEYDFSPLDL